jgi:hypothetical protein
MLISNKNESGIICGYYKDFLIAALTQGFYSGWMADKMDTIITHKNHPKGYFYVYPGDIIPAMQNVEKSLDPIFRK